MNAALEAPTVAGNVTLDPPRMGVGPTARAAKRRSAAVVAGRTAPVDSDQACRPDRRVVRGNPLDAVVFKSKGMADFYRYEGRLATMPIIQFMARFGPEASGRLLDVGCGRKPYVNLFPNVRRYIGVDVTAMGADVLGNGQRLPVGAGSVDAVVSNQVLEHTPEPDAVLVEMHRILRAGGLLYLTAPQMARLHGEPHDYYRFTKWGLRYLLGKRGFDILHLEAQGGFCRALGAHLVFFAMEKWGRPGWRQRWLRPILIRPINVLAPMLDRWINWDKDTLGYNVLARKVG